MNQRLQDEVARFRTWAIGREGSYGEWECDYNDWSAFWKASENAIAEAERGQLDSDDALNLLYGIARENETQWLRRFLIGYPRTLRSLAIRSASYPDGDAKWQLACSIADACLPDAVEILQPFLRDEDEYVRRRSLLALSPLCPSQAELLAITGIDSANEYSRMAALEVLHDIGSDHFSDAALRLCADPNEYVPKRAEELIK
ncbi:MAG: HEAT repeat domain-containing protein [Verrucomicrobiaceae bacterium]|nr:MAG: HEAT repeat domain-containing protein [Verrucomicrobiaceae bacterium]